MPEAFLQLQNLKTYFPVERGMIFRRRIGTVKAVTLMERRNWDQPLLKELSQTMVDASICGLGQAAPNPALCVMKYFPQEIE